jgi:hypothetical protein
VRTNKAWLLYICITLTLALLFLRWWNTTRGTAGVEVMPLTPGLDLTLPIFAIIGRTGAGKSTFINALGGLDSGRGPAIGDDLEPCKLQTDYFALVENVDL